MMTFAPGATVKFSNPQPGEESERFVVLEDRDTRVLVGSLDPAFTDWQIPPTFVYAKADLVLVVPPYSVRKALREATLAVGRS